MHFGTDGIRAKEDYFTEDFLLKFASALFLKFGKVRVFIGRDTRSSGYRIARRLGEELRLYGIDVYDGGVLPTPALAFLCALKGCDVGIMVSASHNGPEYNGIKLFKGNGAKIDKSVEKDLENLFLSPVCPIRGRQGNYYEVGKEEYIAFFKENFGEDIVGAKVLIDCCYGATAYLASTIFETLGCQVEGLHNSWDGDKINVECGATNLEKLIKEEKKNNYDISFAYDGDGDRVMVVKNGRVYNGDHVVYAYANYLDALGRLGKRGVVGTLTSNLGLEKALESKGIMLYRAQVGDRQVFEEMVKNELIVGGESSGHVIFREYTNTGDGILTSVIACIMDAKMGLEKLVDMVDYPQEETFVECGEKEKEVFRASSTIKERIKELTNRDVRIVVRPSGTEPKIRIRVESERYERAREIASEIKNLIISVIKENKEKGNEDVISDTQNTIFSGANYEEYTKNGVVILSPETTFIEKGVKIGGGSVIYPFNVIRGRTQIGRGVTIYSYSDLTDVKIGDGSDVRSTYALQVEIGKNSTIGPFATLRKGAVIGDGCRIGDYVEVKNSNLGNGVKASHLSYIGDASVGDGTNVGCGTVFANYNGKIKRKTEVGSNVFIGCNSNLIAPLRIGDNCYIAGGSTITEDVPSDKFVISRGDQKVIDKR